MSNLVLVLDGETRAALAVVRSLGRAGLEVAVAAAREKSLGTESRFASQRLLCPSPAREPAAFQVWLVETVQHLKPALVLPITNATLELALQKRAEIEAHAKFPFVTEDTFQAINNKSHLVELAREMGVAAPQSIAIPNQRSRTPQVDQAIRNFRYPAVLKPAYSDYRVHSAYLKAGVCYPQSAGEVFTLINGLEDGQLAQLPWLLQERISGEGVGVFALCEQGEIVASFCHRRILEKPPSGGVSVLCESIAREQAPFAQTAEMLGRLKWQGVAMVEFKRGAHGKPYLIEINPRFWGSLQLAISSGCDFPRLLWQQVNGEPLPAHPNSYQVGHRLRWPLGTLDHVYLLLKRAPLAALGDFIFKNSLQLLNRPLRTSYDVFALDDPRPGLLELKEYFLRHD